MKHTHIQKRLSRRCPECDGQLCIMAHDEIVNGVKYSKSFVECENCFYQKLYRDFTGRREFDYSQWTDNA